MDLHRALQNGAAGHLEEDHLEVRPVHPHPSERIDLVMRKVVEYQDHTPNPLHD